MRELRIRLFGGLDVHGDGTLLPPFCTQKSRSLFAYLVLHQGRFVNRDVLCGRLWQDLDDRAAKKALRTALWRIRSLIEPDEEDRGAFLEVDGHQVRFRESSRVWVDALEFERCVGASPESASDAIDFEALAIAASLYRGDLLEGMYDEWCESEQVRFRLTYLTVLELLMAHRQHEHRWREAIAIGGRVLHSDPLREHVHRGVMECHVAMGDRPMALRQYWECVRRLDEAFGIGPMAQTRRLYERIKDGDVAGPRPNGAAPNQNNRELVELAADVEGALCTLHSITQRLERARVVLGSSQGNSSGSD